MKDIEASLKRINEETKLKLELCKATLKGKEVVNRDDEKGKGIEEHEEVEEPAGLERLNVLAEQTISVMKKQFSYMLLEEDSLQERQQELERQKELFMEEKEKMRIMIQMNSDRMKLNIGGHKYETSLSTLTKVLTTHIHSFMIFASAFFVITDLVLPMQMEDSMLARMFSGRYNLVKDEHGAVFIDRDGTHFRYILKYPLNIYI